MTGADGETINYDASNKPISIDGPGTNDGTFTYGANIMRYRHTTGPGSRIYYIDKLVEIETTGASTDYRQYISDVAIVTKTGDLNDPNPSIDYILRDRLGSASGIADASGFLFEATAYDPFGKPRDDDWTDRLPPVIGSNVTDRGFTDHEHLDDWQFIHMNGRGYDYNLGRFLSVDPIIQSLFDSRGINAYSYVLNNPLSATDPTGYCAAETGTRIKDCVTVNVVNEDTGKMESKEMNRLHSNFAGQIAEFASETLGSDAVITGISAKYSNGTTLTQGAGAVGIVGDGNTGPSVSTTDITSGSGGASSNDSGSTSSFGASAPPITLQGTREERRDQYENQLNPEQQQALRDWFWQNHPNIFLPHMLARADSMSLHELQVIAVEAMAAVRDVAKDGFTRRTAINVVALQAAGKALLAVPASTLRERVWNYRLAVNAFNQNVNSQFYYPLETGRWLRVNWHLYNINKDETLSVDFYYWVTDQVNKRPPTCAINDSC